MERRTGDEELAFSAGSDYTGDVAVGVLRVHACVEENVTRAAAVDERKKTYILLMRSWPAGIQRGAFVVHRPTHFLKVHNYSFLNLTCASILNTTLFLACQCCHQLVGGVPRNHLLLDRSPNIGPLISRCELDKFKNCWNKSFRTSKILTLLYQQFSNLLISQQDMSDPRLGAPSNNRWSGLAYIQSNHVVFNSIKCVCTINCDTSIKQYVSSSNPLIRQCLQHWNNTLKIYLKGSLLIMNFNWVKY